MKHRARHVVLLVVPLLAGAAILTWLILRAKQANPGGGSFLEGENSVNLDVVVIEHSDGSVLRQEIQKVIVEEGPSEPQAVLGGRLIATKTLYRIEYRWPEVRTDVGHGAKAGPLEIQPQIVGQKVWPYELSMASDGQYLVLKGGMPVHAFEAANSLQALDSAIEWLRPQVSARVSVFVNDYRRLAATQEARTRP